MSMDREVVFFELSSKAMPSRTSKRNCEQLGNWDPNKAFALKFSQGDTWEGEVLLGQAGRIEYKYFISYFETGELLYWEGGPNRVFMVSGSSNYRRDIFRNPV
eukprot:gene13002-15293_t